MSNIERKYSYQDDGVLPVTGENGVTYLTLYSSEAGNIYDGWIYDPDHKTQLSTEERTFGYRNPDYPDYCWDDEVVVDLSNAQSRQEASDFAQGRIWSFNTNVSDQPIILQDIDVTGMSEEERERNATVVLFSAIPLINDSYIQAQVEVSCKCNLSEDNTSGVMKIEAFYILNDESDRTMRPNPVHTFTVATQNERHTLPWIYANPALKHDVSNYIGVKLICTGGTAEIGISDVREYGDAMITIVSAGMTGDSIFSGRPMALEIFGYDEVPPGYRLNIEDYTVLCTYDTGELYDVTRMCSFSPAMGTRLTESETVLTATYMGLQASMLIRLGVIESIELSGLDNFFDEYTLDINDYTVLAYLDNGDIFDVTYDCAYVPAMGTTLTQDATLLATYEDEYSDPPITYTDSMDITKYSDIIVESPNNGLEYHLRTSHLVEITGDSRLELDNGCKVYECIELPTSIRNYFKNNHITYYDLKWSATGPISGMSLLAYHNGGFVDGTFYGSVRKIIGFENVNVRPYYYYISPEAGSNISSNIVFDFTDNNMMQNDGLNALCRNIRYDRAEHSGGLVPVHICGRGGLYDFPNFKNCKAITDLNFMEYWIMDVGVTLSRSNMMQKFMGCESLQDITGFSHIDSSIFNQIDYLFYDCLSLEDFSPLVEMDFSNVGTANYAFCYTGIRDLSVLAGGWNIGENSITGVKLWFENCNNLIDLRGFKEFINASPYVKALSFKNCENLETLNGSQGADMSSIRECSFVGCTRLRNIDAVTGWNTSSFTTYSSMFSGCPIDDLSPASFFDYNYTTKPDCKGMFSQGSSGFVPSRGNYIDYPGYDNKDKAYASISIGPEVIVSGERGNWCNTRNGMFYPYDRAFRVSDTGIIRFENSSALPMWYKDAMIDDINSQY